MLKHIKMTLNAFVLMAMGDFEAMFVTLIIPPLPAVAGIPPLMVFTGLLSPF